MYINTVDAFYVLKNCLYAHIYHSDRNDVIPFSEIRRAQEAIKKFHFSFSLKQDKSAEVLEMYKDEGAAVIKKLNDFHKLYKTRLVA